MLAVDPLCYSGMTSNVLNDASCAYTCGIIRSHLIMCINAVAQSMLLDSVTTDDSGFYYCELYRRGHEVVSENLQHLVVTNEQVDIVDNEIVATDGNAELTCPLPSFAQLASVIQFGDKVSHFLDSTRHTKKQDISINLAKSNCRLARRSHQPKRHSLSCHIARHG